MKLNLKISNALPRVEKVKLNSDLVELFDTYVQFYQREYKGVITSEQAIIEMITAFISSDRAFMRWYRERDLTQTEERIVSDSSKGELML